MRLFYKRPRTALQWLIAQSRGGRSEQQDAAVVLNGNDESTALVILADGAGGHRGGRLASQKVMEIGCRFFKRGGLRLKDPGKQLTTLCQEAHEEINCLAETAKSAPRSTIVALYIEDEQSWWASVGDSRLYRIRGGQVLERTRDHTMAQILFEQGEIKDSDIPHHPDRTQLLKALGGEEICKPSLGSAQIKAGDGFILCSDGFWENTSAAEIGALFLTRITQQNLDYLVKSTASRNGASSDNVTACTMVVTVSSKR